MHLNFPKCFKLPRYSKDKKETDVNVTVQTLPGLPGCPVVQSKDINFSIIKLILTEEQARNDSIFLSTFPSHVV